MRERRYLRRLREFKNNARKPLANIVHGDVSKTGEEEQDDFHR